MRPLKLYFVALFAMGQCITSNAQWVLQNSGSTTNKFESVYFFDANNGIISGSGGIIKTTNAGAVWTPVAVGGIRDIDFTSTTTGYAAGITSASLKKTTNGGTSWTALTPINSSSLWGVSVVDANTSYMCGVSGIVWKTINGGTSFSAVNTGVSDLMVDLQFFNATTGCVLDQNGKVYRTTNGGASWTITYTTTGVLFTSIFFVNSTTGFAVGSAGKVIKTTDGGLTWVAQTTGSSSYLQYVDFYDVNNGIVVGTGGTILRTTDGGANWFAENSGITKSLSACILLSPTAAIVAGDSGTVMTNVNLLAGIDQAVLPEASVLTYPNPFADELTCILSGDFPDKDLSIDLYNLEGKLVQTTVITKDKNVIKTSCLAAGTYIYAVKQKGVLIKQGKVIKTE